MAERWASIVRPWCTQLRSHTKMAIERNAQIDAMDAAADAWVLKISIATTSADTLLTCREALELLAVVARVDKRGWYELLHELCGCVGNNTHLVASVARAPSVPRVCFAVHRLAIRHEHALETIVLQRLLLPTTESSTEFRNALQRLQHRMTSAMRIAFAASHNTQWCTTLQFTPPEIYLVDPATYLQSTLAFVRALGDHVVMSAASTQPQTTTTDPLATTFLFRLTRAELDPMRMVLRATDAAAAVCRLAACGVQFAPYARLLDSERCSMPLTCLGPIWLDATDAQARSFDAGARIVSSVGAPVAPLAGPLRPLRPLQRVFASHAQTLSVGWQRMQYTEATKEQAPRFQALCSAIATAQSVQTFAVTFCFAQVLPRACVVQWRWLAFAVLSKAAAQCSVTTLVLTGMIFAAAEVRAIVDVLALKFPVSALMDVQSVADCFGLSLGSDTDEQQVWHAAARYLGLASRASVAPRGRQSHLSQARGMRYIAPSTATGRGRGDAARTLTNAALAPTYNVPWATAAPTSQPMVPAAALLGMEQNQFAAFMATMPPHLATETFQSQAEQHRIIMERLQAQQHRITEQLLANGRQIDQRAVPLAAMPTAVSPTAMAAILPPNRYTMPADVDFGAALLKRGAVVYVAPFVDATKAPETLTIDCDDALFPIIRDDARCPWIDIVVPGYGACAVARPFVAHIELNVDDDDGDDDSVRSSLAQGYDGAITSLSLTFEVLEASTDIVLLPLLAYVGPRLVTLVLDVPLDNDPNALLRLLDACPRLQSLTIHVALSSRVLPAIADALDAGRYRRLETLEVRQCPSDAHTLAFVERLQDPQSGTAQSLRHLMLRCSDRPPFGININVLTAVARALHVSQTLESVELSVSAMLPRDLWLALVRTDGMSLPGIKTPLPLAARIAFLSVLVRLRVRSNDDTRPRKRLRGNDTTSSTSSISTSTSTSTGVELDEYVIASIFVFAAEPKERNVRLLVHGIDAHEGLADVARRHHRRRRYYGRGSDGENTPPSGEDEYYMETPPDEYYDYDSEVHETDET